VHLISEKIFFSRTRNAGKKRKEEIFFFSFLGRG
jgi:hypothetical protein